MTTTTLSFIEPAAASAASSERGARNTAVEALRFVACLGIVWFHAKAPGASIGYGGLPALMAISVALAARRKESQPLGWLLWSRADRLLLPWLVWSVVYAAANMASARVSGDALTSKFAAWMLLAGPSMHLWYLPFAFVVTVLAAWACGSMARASGSRSWLGWAALSALLVPVSSVLLGRVDAYPPLGQWVFVLPSVPAGLALGRSAQAGDAGTRRACAIVVAVLSLLACVASFAAGYPRLTIPYVVGISGAALAWAAPTGGAAWLTRLGGLAFGVYLVHPLVAAVLLRVNHSAWTLTHAAVVAGLSVAAAIIMRATPLKRFI